MKQHQLSQLDKLEQERINLRENATKISENYEDIKDNLENLNKRVHLVIEHLKVRFRQGISFKVNQRSLVQNFSFV